MFIVNTTYYAVTIVVSGLCCSTGLSVLQIWFCSKLLLEAVVQEAMLMHRANPVRDQVGGTLF